MATAPAAFSNLTDETGSPALSIGGWDLAMIRNLPERIDDATMASLEVVASSPLPSAPACDDRHFNQCLRIMDAALPKRSQDDFGGELLIRTYRRMLGHLTAAAVSHLSAEAIAKCRWFPTVAECLAMVEGFREPPSEVRHLRDAARGRLGRERQLRFGAAMDALDAGEMTIERFVTLPERWRGIAVETGRVWALRDGGYALRPHTAEERRARAAELQEAGLL